MKSIEYMIRYDEGSEEELYRDNLGYFTIGIGHLVTKENCSKERAIKILDSQLNRVTNGRVTASEISMMFNVDLLTVQQGIRRSSFGSVYEGLDTVRRMALVNMSFQLGLNGLSKFKKFLAALDRKDWDGAAKEGFNSTWAKQTPNRAKRVMDMVKTGTTDSYK